MSIEAKYPGGQEDRRLVVRLRQHLDSLSRVQLTGDEGAARLQDAIAELRKDIEDLDVIAPHVYVSPSPR